jgi:SEC-C motif
MTNPAFERSSKRRKGYPSEKAVKRGHQIVHGEKELLEKLGRNDLCPCGSGRRFQTMLPRDRQVRWLKSELLLSENGLDIRFFFAYTGGR